MKSNPDSATKAPEGAPPPEIPAQNRPDRLPASSSLRAPPPNTADSPEDEHAPLSIAERTEMGQLLAAFGAEPMIPGQPRHAATPENYERLKQLHARAAYEEDNWHEDGEAVDRESVAALDLVVQAIRIIINTVPAAAAANQTLALLNDSHARMKAAMIPPPPVPELPPDPAEAEARAKAEADRAADERKAKEPA